MKHIKAKCKKCGEIVVGDGKGTYIQCECRSVAIDETQDYCRIIGNEENYEIIEDDEEYKTTLEQTLINLEIARSSYDDYWIENAEIEQLQDYINKMKETIKEKDKQIIIMERYFELISDLGFDYDGLGTVYSLKSLIDELVHYASLGRVCNTDEVIYCDGKKQYNILNEEIK